MNDSPLFKCLVLSAILGTFSGCLTEDDPIVACTEDLDCPASLPLCELELGACTPCDSDAHCSAQAQSPHCDADSGQCVECNEDEQCSQGLCLNHACARACQDDTQCSPDKPVCKDARCVAGCRSDAHCEPEAPRCDTEAELCVQCLSEDDCEAPTPLCKGQRCVSGCRSDADCSGETPVCDLARSACVQCFQHAQCEGDRPVCMDQRCVPGCLQDTDCTEPEAARCGPDYQCLPCSDDAECVGVRGRAICEAGTCVQCTVDDESACGSRSCDPSTLACTQTKRGSIGVCGPCLADSECGDEQDQESEVHRCIALEYMGLPQGGRCLQTPEFASEPPCPRPFGVPIERESLSGAAPSVYCGINEELTTCEAVLAGSGGVTCPSGSSTECAAEGALCEQFGIAGNFCTYPCASGAECSSNFPSCGEAGFCTAAPSR